MPWTSCIIIVPRLPPTDMKTMTAPPGYANREYKTSAQKKACYRAFRRQIKRHPAIPIYRCIQSYPYACLELSIFQFPQFLKKKFGRSSLVVEAQLPHRSGRPKPVGQPFSANSRAAHSAPLEWSKT